MLCRNPIGLGDGVYVPCGGCIPCRVQKRRLWASRLELEAHTHTEKVFLTLTYDDERLPEGATLKPKHVQDWLKRIRKAVEPLPLRFFACGEYGDKTERPHYHAILFGYPECTGTAFNTAVAGCACSSCSTVRKTWGHGHILSGRVTAQSCRYIAGYVTKKMQSKGHPDLNGREPEFARWSNRPGLGVPALKMIAQAMIDGFQAWDKDVDVPTHVMASDHKLVFSKYLRGKLREELGRSKETPEAVKRQWLENMQTVLMAAKENDLLPKEVHAALDGMRMDRMEFYERNAKRKRTL